MAVDYFLKLDGIDGESEDQNHPKWIDIIAFSWAARQPGSFGQGQGGTVGKVGMDDFNFVTVASKATPELLKACATGKHIKSATLVCRKSTGDGGQADYATWTMAPVIISSYNAGGAANDPVPVENFSLNFGSIKLEYKVQTDSSGTLAAIPAFSWDLTKNAPGQ
jgi:type VI secretion system secreted protein Hcp